VFTRSAPLCHPVLSLCILCLLLPAASQVRYSYTLGSGRIPRSANPESATTTLTPVSASRLAVFHINQAVARCNANICPVLLSRIPTIVIESPLHNGRPSKLPAQLPGHQVGHDSRTVELQHVLFRPTPNGLRVQELQDQDLPAVCIQSIGELTIAFPKVAQPVLLRMEFA
jgi:hypothetical protein